MSNSGKIGLSVFGAVFGTFLVVARQSLSYLRDNTTEVVSIFILLTGGGLFYFFKINNKHEMICPKCEELFQTTKPENAFCSNCKVKAVELKGFYDNQPKSKT
jgi:hypothetical protein